MTAGRAAKPGIDRGLPSPRAVSAAMPPDSAPIVWDLCRADFSFLRLLSPFLFLAYKHEKDDPLTSIGEKELHVVDILKEGIGRCAQDGAIQTGENGIKLVAA